MITGNMQPKVIVLGAGVSGLGLAWRLSSRGVEVCVLEANPQVGGLARTERTDGYCLDVGPHSFFSEDEAVRDSVLSLFDPPLVPAARTVQFYYDGKYLDYPLTPANVLFGMGVGKGVRSALSFLKSRFHRHAVVDDPDDETVEAWAIRSFGDHLYRTFFKPYTEQFWKVPCTQLSARSIPTHTRMSFIHTLQVLLHRKIEKLDPSLIEREMLPTYYPTTGFGEIPERIAATVRKNGGTILTNCRATTISDRADDRVRVTYVGNGNPQTVEGTHLVSTIPLRDLASSFDPVAPPNVLASARALTYRPLVVLGMVTDRQSVLKASYIYVMNKPYNRISEANRFSPATSPSGENIVAVEMACLRDSAAWHASKEELFNMCIGSLATDGFLSPGDVKRLLLVKALDTYPIYQVGYAAHLKRVMEHLRSRRNVSTLGRTGEFRYMDSDVCIRRAFLLADNLLESQD
jgi:protoporphyrinogen oxidase